MIGEDAKQKQEINYSDMFSRMAYVGNLFEMAESFTSTDRPLLNVSPRVYSIERDGIKVQAFSDVPVSEQHDLVLAIGSPETGFYQVPIIQLAGGEGKEGIDVMVSGTINDEGVPEKFDKAKNLSNMSQDLYQTGTDGARKVYAVALMPKTDKLGQDVLVAGRSTKHYPLSAVYHMIVNGFAMKRKIVSQGDYSGLGFNKAGFVPVMYPQKDGEERFLRLGDILDQKQLAEAESQEVFPGLTFVAGRFQEKFESPVFRNLSRESGTLGFGSDTLTRGATKGGAGRVGLEVGSESDVRYGRTKGSITSIDGILAMHFLGVEEGADPAQIRAEIEKLVR